MASFTWPSTSFMQDVAVTLCIVGAVVTAFIISLCVTFSRSYDDGIHEDLMKDSEKD